MIKFQLHESKAFLSFLAIFLGFVGISSALVGNYSIAILFIASLSLMFVTEKTKRKAEELRKMQQDTEEFLRKIEEHYGYRSPQ